MQLNFRVSIMAIVLVFMMLMVSAAPPSMADRKQELRARILSANAQKLAAYQKREEDFFNPDPKQRRRR